MTVCTDGTVQTTMGYDFHSPDPHINIQHKYSNIFLNTITQQPGVESHHGQAGKLEKNESLKC